MEILNTLISNIVIIGSFVTVIYYLNKIYKDYKLDKKAEKVEKYKKENEFENSLIEIRAENKIIKEITLKILEKVIK